MRTETLTPYRRSMNVAAIALEAAEERLLVALRHAADRETEQRLEVSLRHIHRAMEGLR